MTSQKTLGSRITFILTIWLSIFAAIFVSVAVEKTAGATEGHVMPVVVNGTLVEAEPVDPFHTRVWLTVDKVRDCEYQRVDWRFGAIGDVYSVPVTVNFEEQPKIRGRGNHRLGPWIIGMGIDALRYRSHAYIVHRCHPFWDTKSMLYDSRVNDGTHVFSTP